MHIDWNATEMNKFLNHSMELLRDYMTYTAAYLLHFKCKSLEKVTFVRQE